MASVGTVDPKGLEGRQEGEPTAPRSRDFFWDSVVLFVVTAILALTAIDVVAEFIRGSVVQCFLPNDTSGTGLEAVQDYVNEICAGSLPRTEYLPAYITIHAILILAPHYLWLNMFGANLDFFFQHVSQLVRTRDEKTGEYAKKNYVISQQLEEAFSRSNWMYRLYLLKLFLQFIVSVIGFGLVLGYFSDYREVYKCPASDDELDTVSEYWPLQNQTVRCVFTSLRLLGRIHQIYLVLLALAIVCLLVAIVWCIKLHISELAVERQANFCFQSSIPLNHYTPQLPISRICPGLGSIAYGLLSYLPYIYWPSPYNIQSDYDFLVIKLFRTDGGLAHILREVHVLRLLKEKNNEEYARINIFRRQMPYKGIKELAKAKFLRADIGWELPSSEQRHKQVPRDTLLSVPDSVRGAVLGFAARCQGDIVHTGDSDPSAEEERSLSTALCVCFGSESLGFAGALTKVFARVGIINFSPYYMDYEDPVKIDINNDSQLVIVTCPDDILTSGKRIKEKKEGLEGEREDDQGEKAERKFLDYLDEVWKPGIIATRARDDIEFAKKLAEDQRKAMERKKAGEEEESDSDTESFVFEADKITALKCDYIVIGPLSTHLQTATVNILLEQISDFISNNALLLTILPKEIAGMTVKGCFRPYKPPSDYSKMSQRARVLPSKPPLVWSSHQTEQQVQSSPQQTQEQSTTPLQSEEQPPKRESFNWKLSAGEASCVLHLTLYERVVKSTQEGGTSSSSSAAAPIDVDGSSDSD